MKDIAEILKKNRESISDSSIKTYCSVIKNLYMKIAEKTDISNAPSFFEKEHKKTIDFLKDHYPFNTRKTKLAALVVLLDDKSKAKEEYQKQMLVDISKYNESKKPQEKTEEQEKNWKEQDEIMEKVKLMKKKIQPLWKNPSKKELEHLQDFVIASLYTSIAPRRLLDYTEFKLRNVDTETDNYREKNKFIFNKYKTAKKYHKQDVEIPASLRMLIQKWSKLHNNDYLLFDIKTEKKLTSPQLNKKLNEIFGVSVNMLRSIYISDKIDMPKMEEITDMAEDMGTSADMAINHYKKFEKKNK